MQRLWDWLSNCSNSLFDMNGDFTSHQFERRSEVVASGAISRGWVVNIHNITSPDIYFVTSATTDVPFV